MEKSKSPAEIKQAIVNHCIAFGIFETAKKIADSPSQAKVMLEYLLAEDFGEEAALILKTVFSESVQKEVASLNLPSIEDGFSRNQMVNKYHLELTGESLQDSKRRLKGLKRQKQAEEAAAKTQEKIEAMPKESADGVPFATYAGLGYSEENTFFVDKLEDFAAASSALDKEEGAIAVDFLYGGQLMTTFAVASAKKVLVVDMLALAKHAEVKDWLTALLKDEKRQKVTHSFSHDVNRLRKLLALSAEDFQGIVELSDLVRTEDEPEKRRSQQFMAEKYLKLSVNKAWNKFNWRNRPLETQMVDYAGTLAALNVHIYQKFMEENPEATPEKFVYVEPQTASRRNRGKSTTKRKSSPAKGKKGAEKDKSRKRRATSRRNRRGGARRKRSPVKKEE